MPLSSCLCLESHPFSRAPSGLSRLQELKERNGRGRIPPMSCRSLLSQMVLTANGTTVPARLTITSCTSEDEEGEGTAEDRAWFIKVSVCLYVCVC